MKRIKEPLRCLLWPGKVWVLVLVPASGAGLAIVFLNGLENTPISYGVYVVSAYALTILVASLKGLPETFKTIAYRNKHAKRYLTDIPYRVLVGMVGALILNLLFAALKLVAGIFYASFWSIAIGLYYAVLCVVRVHLLRHLRRPNMDLKEEYQEYRRCGWMLIGMHIALTGVVFQMVQRGSGYEYPGLLIFAVAAYAFYSITVSIVNVIRYRKLKSPILSASKTISLATALVAILTLQTGLFSAFGGEDASLKPIMNAATGSAVLLLILGMAIYMVLRANWALKKMGRERPDKMIRLVKNTNEYTEDECI